MTGAVRKFLAENPEKVRRARVAQARTRSCQAVCKQRYIEFGCEGQGAKSKATACRTWLAVRGGHAGPSCALSALLLPDESPAARDARRAFLRPGFTSGLVSSLYIRQRRQSGNC